MLISPTKSIYGIRFSDNKELVILLQGRINKPFLIEQPKMKALGSPLFFKHVNPNLEKSYTQTKSQEVKQK